MNMETKITDDVLRGFVHCSFKGHLLLNGESGSKGDYELLQQELKEECSAELLRNIQHEYRFTEISKESNSVLKDLRNGIPMIVAAQITYGDLSAHFDAIQRVNGESALGSFHYVPVIFSRSNKASREEKLLLAFRAIVLSRLQNRPPDYGHLIYGPSCKTVKIKLQRETNNVSPLIEKVKGLAFAPPPLLLSRHCQICEFREKCREKAIAEDNISLLGNVTKKEIIKYHQKGIFTLTQLSYTFRPRRKRKKPEGYRKPHSISLHALAVRERKVYVYDTPKLPQTKIDACLDIEGSEDGRSIYLIGLLVKEGERNSQYSLWANNPEEEKEIFLSFVEIMKAYDEYTLYHYGDYELTYLKRMKRIFNSEGDALDKIKGNSFNLLSPFYSHIYLPTYTNGLKEVGSFLGFDWSDKEASGIQGLVWRKQWERSGLPNLKNRLIQYNIQDCQVLLRVKGFVEGIISNESADKEDTLSGCIYLKDLKRPSPFKFLIGDFALPEFQQLNKFAHFDYQRERVYIRSSDYLKKYYSKGKTIKKRQEYNENTSIGPLKKEACPICNKISIKMVRGLTKKVVDLKFSEGGVKRWVAKLNSYVYYCTKCKNKFIPHWYRENERKYGHNIMAWTVYQHIVGKQSFRQVADNLKEVFNLHVEKSNTHIFKSYIMDYYHQTFDNISRNILNSAVIYVDETPIIMRYESGYAWVITNTEEVVSFYRPTREADFIRQHLVNFKGILVSDFYSAYDSLDCLQQKCLMHLIRDFNDDLLKNPFDEEFKEMTKEFSFLLQEIVCAIDLHGLKRRFLNKYSTSVNRFFGRTLSKSYNSEVAKQYQKRLAKYRDKLFLFLEYDNVSWNNNAAEHAIKMLATHTNRNLNFFRESRMEEYLKIMSIYQTCRSKGISFLKFMLSKERNLDNYCNEFIKKRRIIPLFK